MGSKQKRKRERNKRARRTKRSPAVGDERQQVQLGPLELALEGTHVMMRVDSEHPEFEQFRGAQIAQAAATPETVLALRQRIAEICAGYHAFDVIIAMWLTYALVRPDTLRPLAPDGPPGAAQYVAHVLLDRDQPGPVRKPTDEEMRNSVDPQELGELVKEILAGMPVWFHYRQTQDADRNDPWLDLRTRFYSHRLAISSFTYDWQEKETLLELFEPFAKQLIEVVGFDAKQAIELAEKLGQLLLDGATKRGALARKQAGELRVKVEEARRKGATGDALIDKLAALPAKDADQWIMGASMSWMSYGLGDSASFTASDLAEAAGVSDEVASSFLDTFSVEFGDRKDRERWDEDPAKAVGGEMETMRRRPILHDGKGNYLPVAVDTVFYGVRDVLTQTLNDTNTWTRFDRHRAELLEQRATAALSKGLKADWTHSGVKYRYLDEDGEEKEGEADGVIRAGTLAVLVEAKAGSLAPSARRAAPARLERGLKDLVVAAHEQLGASNAALIKGKAIKVTERFGKPLDLDLEGVNRTLRIAVSLEDLSPVAPAIWQLQEAGLLPNDERAPWVVGIHELELISDLSESPGQLLHYILRRLRAIRQHLWAMDEMDFFMKYLLDGLFFTEEEVAERTQIDLHSHTDALDEYIYGQQGLRPKTKRPKQKMDGAVREILAQIGETGSLAAIEAQVMILEMSDESRKQLTSGMRRLATMVAADGEPHDLTLIFENDFGVTVHCVPAGLEAELPGRLRRHGAGRAERSNFRRWVGLGTVLGDKPKIKAMAVILDPGRLEDE